MPRPRRGDALVGVCRSVRLCGVAGTLVRLVVVLAAAVVVVVVSEPIDRYQQLPVQPGCPRLRPYRLSTTLTCRRSCEEMTTDLASYTEDAVFRPRKLGGRQVLTWVSEERLATGDGQVRVVRRRCLLKLTGCQYEFELG